MSLFRKKQWFLVSFFHDWASWEDWDVPIDLTCVIHIVYWLRVDKKCAAILNILLCRCPVHVWRFIFAGQCAGAEVADVSEYLLICAARRRQRGFVITICMALVVSEGRPWFSYSCGFENICFRRETGGGVTTRLRSTFECAAWVNGLWRTFPG